uniref:Uncharacterized protein n=1 Tax=Acidianus brierleyi TaxID=41673 RepID=A0A2U9IE85_9CREN
MENNILLLIIIITVILMSLIASSLYFISTTFTISASSIQKEALSLTEGFTSTVSPITYKVNLGKTISQSNYTVNFLFIPSISNYNGNIYIVPFIASPQLNYYYYIPSNNAEIHLSFPSVSINKIEFPQGGGLLVNVNAYKIDNGNTINITATVKNNEIIYFWIIVNISGILYRIATPYVNPWDYGLGVYVATTSGSYTVSSFSNSAVTPHSKLGDSFGFWFEEIGTGNIILSNYTYEAANKVNLSIVIYLINSHINTTIYENGIYKRSFTVAISKNSWYYFDARYNSRNGFLVQLILQLN